MAKWLYKSVLHRSLYYVYAKQPNKHVSIRVRNGGIATSSVIRQFKRRKSARKFAAK